MQRALIIVLILFSCTVAQADEVKVRNGGRGVDGCAQSLLAHVKDASESSYSPLSKFPELMKSMSAATLLVKLPKTISATQPQVDAAFAGAGLTAPANLRGVHLGESYAVVSGKKIDLEKFAIRLGSQFDGVKADDIEFQILDAKIRPLEIPRPSRSLMSTDAKLDSIIAGMKSAFVVLDEGLRPYAFFPKGSIDTIVRFSADGLNRYHLYRISIETPASWAEWLKPGGNDLRDGAIIETEDWVILTQRAYSFANQLARSLDSARDRMANISDDLRGGIQLCMGATCETEPTARKTAAREEKQHSDSQPQILDNENISKIIDYLGKAAGLRITGSGQLRLAFEKLVAESDKSQAAEIYRSELQSIGMPDTLYNMLKMRPVGRLALKRFVDAWRAYLKLKGLPEAEAEINGETVNQALNSLAHLPAYTASEPPAEPPEETAFSSVEETTSIVPMVVPPPVIEEAPDQEALREWAESYVGAFAELIERERLKSLLPLDVDLDPAKTIFTDSFRRDLVIAEIGRKEQLLDFRLNHNLADLNLDLAIYAPDGRKDEAEKILDVTADESRRFEQMLDLLFDSSKPVVFYHFENLLSFPIEEKQFVMSALAKMGKPVIIYGNAEAKNVVGIILRQASWRSYSSDFIYVEKEDFTQPPYLTQTPSSGFNLAYEARATKSLNALKLSNTPRFRRVCAALQHLANDPYYPSLNSVSGQRDITRRYGSDVFRSKVNDGPNAMRIIWRYQGGNGHGREIRVLDIVDHHIYD